MGSLNKKMHSRTAIDYFRTHRFRLIVPIIATLAIIVAGLWAAIIALRPLPPRTVTMVTGPEGGAFLRWGNVIKNF